MKKQRYVIVRGQVFTWEEKAPFVQSGKSVQGAIEYDQDADALKCHECGKWFPGGGLAVHVAHKVRSGVIVSARDYKFKHGLRQGTGLTTPRARALMRSKILAQARPPLRPPADHSRDAWAPERPRINHEFRNENGSCAAQALFEIRNKAAELGRTPGVDGVSDKLRSAACRHYGSWNAAIKAAGLEPNNVAIAHPKEMLLETLRDFYVYNKRLPEKREWGMGRLASNVTYCKHFGSIIQAYHAAGLGHVYLNDPNRVGRILEHNGKRMNVSEWAREKGMERDILWGRLRLGWSVARALDTPVQDRKDNLKNLKGRAEVTESETLKEGTCE